MFFSVCRIIEPGPLSTPLTDGNLQPWRVAVAPSEDNGLSEAGRDRNGSAGASEAVTRQDWSAQVADPCRDRR